MDKDSYEKGFQDGHKCCAYEKEKLKAENARYREALQLCASRAGFPNSTHACRLVIETAREALNENND